MLQTSGKIGLNDVAKEFGFPNATPMALKVRTHPTTGKIQTWIDGAWRDCNMCSNPLPSDATPTPIKTFYGYDHQAIGIISNSLSGNTTVSVGDTVTYTATVSGPNTQGVINWYKFENGALTSLGTGSSKTITWAYPKNAYIKIIVTGTCSGFDIEQDFPITWYCVPPSEGPSLWGNSTIQFGEYVTYPLLNINGTDTDRVITFEKSGNITIHSVIGNEVTVYANSVGSFGLRATITNHCGSYTTPWASLTIVAPPNVYYSDSRTATIYRNNCNSGEVATSVSVTANGGQFTSSVSVADANNIRDAWMQQVANQNATCYIPSGGGGTTYYSDAASYLMSPHCQPGYTNSGKTWITATAGQFTSTVSVAAANAARDAWMQTQADNSGLCVPNCISASASLTYYTTFNKSTGSLYVSNSGTSIINFHYSRTGSSYNETVVIGAGYSGNITLNNGGTAFNANETINCSAWLDGYGACAIYFQITAV